MAKMVLLGLYGIIGREPYTDGQGSLRLFAPENWSSVAAVSPTTDFPNSPGLSPVRAKIVEATGTPNETTYLVQQTVAQIQAAANA